MKQLTGPFITLSTTGTYANISINNAPSAYQQAFSFIAEETTISYFWIRVGNVGGTDSLRKITFELQADSTGKPSDSALASYEVTGGWTASTQRKIEPGWSTTLTVGARYWIVIKNTSVAPTIDYIGTAGSTLFQPVQSSTYNVVAAPFIRRQFNGTNWTTTVLDHFTTITIKYPSGALQGNAANAAIGYSVPWLISTTRACGTEFQVPGNAILNVIAVSLFIISTPATKLRAYRNRSLIAESPYSAEAISNSRFVTLPLQFQAYPGDWIAIMTEAIASSNGQVGGNMITNDAEFLSMKQWKNRAIKLENGTTWTVSETDNPLVVLYLDANMPFSPAPLNRRQYFSQR